MTETGLLIRPATPADMAAAGRLGALLVRQHHAFDPQRFIPAGEDVAEGYAWFLGTQLEKRDAVVLVAERGGQVVGYAYATLEPHDWMALRAAAGFLHDVVVDESARRQGVATRLVEAGCDWLRARGAPRVLLWSAAGNTAAQSLFDGMGFRRTMIEMTRELEAGAGEPTRADSA
ncbi:MAG TPA: GNAT family N-acetyltransferase [Vicinamibacteria bacterium]|nr:GNAT family N-acetyltransferase [Vicinamibacteria bacterium]